jgi:DNA replication and repair protein RecF
LKGKVLQILSLSLQNFRNFTEKSFSFGSGLNFILSENGKGKTNLVEAIYLLGTGVSLKRSKVGALIEHGHSAATVSGLCSDDVGSFSLSVTLESGRRQISRDGKLITKMKDFLGNFLVIGFSPDSLGVVKGGAAVRRGLVDKHVIELNPHLIDVYNSYSLTLAHKRALLKQGAGSSDIRMWNELLSRSGWEIVQRRYEVVDKLNANFSEVFQDLFGEGIELKLKYTTTFGGVRSEQEAFKILEKHLERELRFRRPQIGTHLDDIEILMCGRPIKEFGSQGQIRAATLTLTVATARSLYDSLNQAPVLILDDVDSELDEKRRISLLRVIEATGWQVFVTSTNLGLVGNLCGEGIDVLFL